MPARLLDRSASSSTTSTTVRSVRAAIESALDQTRAAQVIVVDDGSSDGSKEQIASFGGRILSVFQPNGGQASAMNHGIRLATGDLVVFLDSDDLLESHAVERLLDLWRPATVLGQFPLTILDADGRSCGVYPDPPGLNWRMATCGASY